MKFGRRIKVSAHPITKPMLLPADTSQDSRYSEWADQYVSYGQLKKQIKSVSPWTDTAEAEFVQTLQRELSKCETFQREKAEELMTRINALEREVVGLVDKADEEDEDHDGEGGHERTPGDVERHVRNNRDDDGGSDDDDDGSDGVSDADSIEERLSLIHI